MPEVGASDRKEKGKTIRAADERLPVLERKGMKVQTTPDSKQRVILKVC